MYTWLISLVLNVQIGVLQTIPVGGLFLENVIDFSC